MRFLCKIGFHKWLNIKQTDRQSLRCVIRDRITGKRNGHSMNFDLLFDRVCQYCGNRDDQISQAKTEIEAEEQLRAKYLEAII